MFIVLPASRREGCRRIRVSASAGRAFGARRGRLADSAPRSPVACRQRRIGLEPQADVELPAMNNAWTALNDG
jgi:hypothetical protein